MIHLGFEVGTGNPVTVPEGHTVFLGQSNVSGKTTALEGLASRSGYACLAFVTKVKEGAFQRVPKGLLHPLAPYYEETTALRPRQKLEWREVRDLCEAVTGDGWDKFERTALRKMCRAGHFGRPGSKLRAEWKKPKTLEELLENMEIALDKATGNREWIIGNIHDDLAEALDEIEPLKKKCRPPDLKIGLNVVNLIREHEHLQSLVVASMLKWVRQKREHTIIALPEAWKFTDAQKRTAVGQAARHYIREGAAARNYLWIDSQTIGRLNTELLSQVTVWLFGVQKWSKELEHALNAMPDHYWPERTDIQTLGKGEFLVCFNLDRGSYMYRTYVQPAWMNFTHAQAIARREVEIESAEEIGREFERQQRVSL